MSNRFWIALTVLLLATLACSISLGASTNIESPITQVIQVTPIVPLTQASSTTQVVTTRKTDRAEQTSRPHIIGISVNAPQPVLAPDGKSINQYGGLYSLADEHSTILPPKTVPGHKDYLFFLASENNLNTSNGMLVLSGGSGPDENGQWTLDFAHDYGLYDPQGGPGMTNGKVFIAPIMRTDCPSVADATDQDPTFDLNYATGGSVVIDPTNPGEHELLMVYEGTNRCIGLKGGETENATDSFYATIGVATSSKYGRLWPFYRTNFSLQPKEGDQGPMAPEDGAFGPLVCMGYKNCNKSNSRIPLTYGRYPVISPTYTIKEAIATGETLSGSPDKKEIMGYQTPSAFVDDVNIGSGVYIYSVQGFGCDERCPYSTNGQTISRAKLNGGTAPLKFMNWFNGSFDETTLPYPVQQCPAGEKCQDLTNTGRGSDGGGLTSPIFTPSPSDGSFTSCQSPDVGKNGAHLQQKLMGSISYVDETQEYLLTFLCKSQGDPANGESTDDGNYGVALFYSTLDATQYDLSRQDKWSTPNEIAGSWEWLTSNQQEGSQLSYCDNHQWYSTFMSLNSKPGHLSTQGFVFSLYGCLDGPAAHPREYTSRSFTIATAPSPVVVNMSIAPVGLNFGNVNDGQSANQTITIANQASSTAALTGNVGTLSAPFSVVSGGGAFNLSPGQSVTVTLQFSPTMAGPASASLPITHNATNQTSPTNLSLGGTGVNIPVISVTPTSKDYGKVKVKGTKSASFVVKNTGAADLSISGSKLTGTDASMFSITSGGGSETISPGKSLTIKVAFKSTSAGSKSAILEITSNDPNTPTMDVPLTGTGQ